MPPDNVTADPGTGGAVFATDDIASVHYPRNKVVWGPDGTANDADIASGKPLPVQLRKSDGTELVVGSAVKVDGSAVTQPVSGTVAVSTLPALVAGTANIGDVDVLSSALPTGASTLAEQQTQTTALQLIDDTVATTAAAIPAKGIAVSGTDGTNARVLKTDAGGELQVDVLTLPALVAGSANIGDVDVLSLPAIPAGGNKIGAVDLDSDATIAAAVPTVAQFVAGTDGTNARALKTDTSGELQVDVLTSGLPTGASTLAEQQTQTTALQLIDDTVNAPNTAVSKMVAVGAQMDDTAPVLATENNISALRITNNRGLHVNLRDAAGTEIGIGGSPLIITPNASIDIVGNVAHDAADSGAPVKVGFQARTSDPTAVANADRVNAIADLNGKQIVLPYAIPENFTDGVTAAITGTADTAVIAAPGAGIRLYITSVLVTNSHATVGTVVELKDGTTVKHRGFAAAAGGGFALTFPAPIRLTANTAFNAANVTTGSNTYVSATGYKAP